MGEGMSTFAVAIVLVIVLVLVLERGRPAKYAKGRWITLVQRSLNQKKKKRTADARRWTRMKKN